jgi:hypothetical protein
MLREGMKSLQVDNYQGNNGAQLELMSDKLNVMWIWRSGNSKHQTANTLFYYQFIIPANLVTYTEAFKLKRPFFLEVLLKSSLHRYGLVWPLGTFMSSTHAPNVGQAESNSNYLRTTWSRVLLEKLTGLQLVKKFPAFYGTRRFLTALTSDRHLSLSW